MMRDGGGDGAWAPLRRRGLWDLRRDRSAGRVRPRRRWDARAGARGVRAGRSTCAARSRVRSPRCVSGLSRPSRVPREKKKPRASQRSPNLAPGFDPQKRQTTPELSLGQVKRNIGIGETLCVRAPGHRLGRGTRPVFPTFSFHHTGHHGRYRDEQLAVRPIQGAHRE